MANFSTYLERAVLNSFFRGQPFTPPGTLYIGAYTAPPTDAGGGTEIATDPNYVRQAIAFAAPAGPPTYVPNGAEIVFPVAGADWGEVTHLGIFDAPTGGNLWAWNLLVDPQDGVTPAPIYIAAGERLVLTAGNVQVFLD